MYWSQMEMLVWFCASNKDNELKICWLFSFTHWITRFTDAIERISEYKSKLVTIVQTRGKSRKNSLNWISMNLVAAATIWTLRSEIAQSCNNTDQREVLKVSELLFVSRSQTSNDITQGFVLERHNHCSRDPLPFCNECLLKTDKVNEA